MCGILGSYRFNFPLEPLLAKQMHRGPDAVGTYEWDLPLGRLQLGHNRLKIICLSDEANQPLLDPSKQHALVFNGEIYNYRELRVQLEKEKGLVFQTESDSEVLLNLLMHDGIEGINACNGMFAVAYFDKQANQLFLIRDRFGVKPLYYYFKNNQLLFASSAQLIAETCGLQPNVEYLKRGLQFGIYEDGSETTAYQAVKSVPAGHYVVFDLQGNVKTSAYYCLADRVVERGTAISSLTDNQLSDEVGALLADAIRLRLHADVPVAVTLSGGLDSASIATISKQQSGVIEGFCFGHPADRRTEGGLAEKVAGKQRLKVHYVVPSTAEWNEAFWKTLMCQEAPFPSLSVVAQYLLYKKVKQQGYKVALGGQGGDEAFLGYRKFQWFHLNELIHQKKWLMAIHFFLGLSQMMWAERNNWSHLWRARLRYRKAKGQEVGLKLPGESISLNMGFSGKMAERQVADILQYSLPTLLRYEDRNSMAHSIESRLPFMDYRLMELACALPVRLKLRKGYGKWVIRDVMQQQVPDEIRLARFKRGFDVAQYAAVQQGLQQSIHETLYASQSLVKMYIDTNTSDYFSSSNLSHSPQRFAELVTLLWLIRQT